MSLNLSEIKRWYYQCPAPVTAPLVYVPFEIFAGKSFRVTKARLKHFDSLPEDEKSAVSRSFLVSKLNDYISHVPFYRRWAQENEVAEITSPEQLFEFPIIGKEELGEGCDDFIHDAAKGLYKVSTGGSSGAPTNFYHTPKCYGREWAFFANFLEANGISVNSRRISLRGVDTFSSGSAIRYNSLYKELMISPSALSTETIKGLWAKISSFGAEWIHGYPSTVYRFCEMLSKLGLSLPKVTTVVLISEQIHDFQRSVIERVLGAKVISFYGMSERVVFAPMVEGVFIPHPLYGVSEIVDGEHVATGFVNDGTCLVRYRTGDRLDAVTNDGLVTVFSEFQGRWSGDSLVGFNGEKINMTVLNSHSEHLRHIDRFQFLQKEKGKVLLLVVPAKSLSDSDFREIAEIFRRKLGSGFELSAKLTDHIEVSPRGKHLYIRSEVIQY